MTGVKGFGLYWQYRVLNEKDAMQTKTDRLTLAGKVISKIANPCFLSTLMLALMALTYSRDSGRIAEWIAALVVFLVLLPEAYVLVRARKEYPFVKLLTSPTAFLKQHPRDVLAIAVLCGVTGGICLFLLDAPPVLLYTYAALLAGSVVIAVLNLYLRVSYHLGAVTIIVIMASLAWGPVALLLLLVLPVIGWAKHRIKEHTLFQLIGGTTVAAIISGVALLLYSF